MNNNIKVNVTGRNINNYLKWLMNQKIDIINLNVKNHNELEVVIDYKDYKIMSKYSKTYQVKITKRYGRLKLLDFLKNNMVIIFCLIFAIILIYGLSHIIFSVEIIYNDREIVDILEKELEKYDIKKFKLKKDSSYLSKIKETILKDNKDILEWLEIEENGTKYTVRLVERKKKTEVKEFQFQSIVASKDAVITSIKAYSGEKVKNINSYVKKDDVIISGILSKPDGTNLYTKAKGSVIGEVWYKVNIEYPLYYQEELVTGKSKNVISFYFLNKKIPLFPYEKYKQFKLESNTIIENNLLPIKFVKERLYEVKVKEEIYTEEEVIDKATELAKQKMLSSNKNIIQIKKVELLDKQNLNSKISLNLFVSVDEDITKVVEVKEEIVETPE